MRPELRNSATCDPQSPELYDSDGAVGFWSPQAILNAELAAGAKSA